MDLGSQQTPPKRRRMLKDLGGVTRVGTEENEDILQSGDGDKRAEDHRGLLDVRESGHPGNYDARRWDQSGVCDATERDHPRDSGASRRDHAVNDNSRDKDFIETFDSCEGRLGGYEASDYSDHLQQKSQVSWIRAETLCEARSGQTSPSERIMDLLTCKAHSSQTTTGRAEEKSPPRLEAFHHPVHRKKRHALKERGHDLVDNSYAPRNGDGMRDLLGRLTVQAPTWLQTPEGGQTSAYTQPYLYPLPFHSLENQGLLLAGKPLRTSAAGATHSAHSALEDIRVPQALRQLSANYQLFAGVKLLEGHPVLAPPLDPVSALEELAYSGGQGPVSHASLEKGPALMEDSPFCAANWHLGLYPPAWSHPLHHLRSNLGASSSAPENGLSARSKESSIRRENVLHLTANDAAPSPATSPPVPASSCRPSDPREARLGQDNKMAAQPYSGRGLEHVWRSEAQQANGRTYMPRKTITSDTQSYQPLRLVEPSLTGSETGLVTSSDRLGVSPHHSASASVESKDFVRSQSPNQSVISDCFPGSRVSIFSQAVESHRATIIAQGRPGLDPLKNLPAEDFKVRGGKKSCDRHIAPERIINGKPHGTHCTERLLETDSVLDDSSKDERIVALTGPRRNHTKMKQTWLTRHSEQFSCHTTNQGYRGSKASQKDDVVKEKGEKTMPQHAEKRPYDHISDEEPLMAPSTTSKRSRLGETEAGNDPDLVGTDPKDLNEPKRSTDSENDQGAQRDSSVLKSVDQPPVSLQNVPCLLLPEGIERCCNCGSPNQGATTPAVCRFMHFRRVVHRNNGQLKADGLSTVDETGDDGTKEADCVLGKASDGPTSLSTAKYLLSTLGDQFCEIIRRDQQSLSWSQQGHKQAVAWRKDRTVLQGCDTCQGTIFNSHWSCSRCGFQMCPGCHKSKEKTLARDGHAEEDLDTKCRCGPEHSLYSLVPTRLISTHVLSQLWKAMHDMRAKYDISANCNCRQTFLTDAVLLGISLSKERTCPAQEKEGKGTSSSALNPITCEEKPELKSIKEECTESAEQPLGDNRPKEAVQNSTLCDLLTSTAVKLCLGQSGVRMAFAPVSQTLPTNDRISSILDNIIAQVVERKIQERQHLDSGDERSLSPPESSLCYPSSPQGGILWLQDPDDTNNNRRFQEHWRHYQQPVLVSGLNKNMKRSLCGLGPLGQELGEQSEPMDSKEFWDSFFASTEIPRDDKSRGGQPTGEWSLEELQPSWIQNLNSCLPLPEYCRPGGKLNLATYLPGQQLWLCPRISAAHGMKFDNRGLGTKSLAAEVTDFLNILVHIEDPDGEFCDGRNFQQEILLRTDDDSMEGLVKEQLWTSRGAPAALWHIFQAEDAEQIRRFLKKVCAEQAQTTVDGTAPSDRQSCYLDLCLLRRLQEECGVKSWALLQFLGDAVVVPAGSPYQMHYFSNAISVTQPFLSPENALLSVHLMRSARKTQPSTQKLSAQMEGAIFAAVKDAVEILQAYN